MQAINFDDAIGAMPLIVALRGIQENEVDDVGKVLIDSGITVLEVTVRTKDAALSGLDDKAVRSLIRLIHVHGKNIHVAAGTVMQVEDLIVLKKADVNVCLSPSLNPNVVREAKRLGISFVPGVETVSEVMSAIASGANGLKIFPSFYYEPDGSVAVRHSPGYVGYLSKFVSCPIFLSGNVGPSDLPTSYLAAGAAGINIGAQLYQPNIGLKELEVRAKRFVDAIRQMQAQRG
jgi:2-dehydro-3-deoxyphosphogalactonate aldolase